MAKVAGGDQQAFADLYDQLAPSVWGLVRNVVDDPIAAQQAMFDALVSVWAHARFFEPGTGSVQLWVSSIAHQRAVAHRAR
ncbi:MAG: sigma factor [Acidimicrobiales bacterium]